MGFLNLGGTHCKHGFKGLMREYTSSASTALCITLYASDSEYLPLTILFSTAPFLCIVNVYVRSPILAIVETKFIQILKVSRDKVKI
jgi:hypothetical protein